MDSLTSYVPHTVFLKLPHPFPFPILLASLSCATLLAFLLFKRYHAAPRLRLPPGPPGLPILGNLLQLGPLPHRFLMQLHKTYGPLVYLRLGSIHTITTNDSHMFREMMNAQDEIFASRYQRVAISYFSNGGKDLVMAPYGEAWKRLRRISVEHLLSARQVSSFRGHRRDEADYMIRDVLNESRKGGLIHLRDVFSAFSLNNTTRMLLGKRFFGLADAGPEDTARMASLTATAFELMGAFNIGDYLPFLKWLDVQGYNRRCRKALAKMEDLVNPVVEDHRLRLNANPDTEPSNFLDTLLALQKEKGEAFLPDTTIKSLIMDMIVAGTDTTSVTNEWAMLHLLRHPHVMRKVQEEIDSVVGKERVLEEEDLVNLPYLRCVMTESLRLSQPAPFIPPRECVKATKVAGYDIPQGTMVLFNVFAQGRNPEAWPERTEEFWPERHMQNQKLIKIEHGAGPDFLYTAFGEGRRRCPGSSMALIIVMLAVGRLLHCFNWAPPPGVEHDQLDEREAFGLSMPLAVPLSAVATPRLPVSLLLDPSHTQEME